MKVVAYVPGRRILKRLVERLLLPKAQKGPGKTLQNLRNLAERQTAGAGECLVS